MTREKKVTQSPEPPLQRLYDLNDLSEAGDEVVIEAGPADLLPLASWLGVVRVERLQATITLRRLAPARFRYEASLSTDILQTCVVSLEPVASHLSRDISRTLHLAPRLPRGQRPVEEPGGVLTLSAGDEDVPEEIENARFDLAGPILEELSLAIEPYPRAEGVSFEAPEGADLAKESPFAALKRLKEGDG